MAAVPAASSAAMANRICSRNHSPQMSPSSQVRSRNADPSASQTDEPKQLESCRNNQHKTQANMLPSLGECMRITRNKGVEMFYGRLMSKKVPEELNDNGEIMSWGTLQKSKND